MKLERVRLTASEINSDAAEVLATKPVYVAMTMGGFIAGGFARSLAHSLLLDRKASIRNYLTPNNQWPRIASTPGDVDIFSPASIDTLKIAAGSRSLGDFAVNVPMKLSQQASAGVKEVNMPWKREYVVQIVDHPRFRYEDVRSCLDSFDLINSRYAIAMDSGAIYLHWDPEAIRLDKSRQIGICRTDTPFLPARVAKYLRFRGCENGLAPGSDDMLTEWLIRASTGTWPEYFNARHKSSIDKHVRLMKMLDLMRVTDLTLFLGKWKQVVRKEKYGQEYIVDWACNQMGEMTEYKNDSA
ncbi:hypothetical protein CMI47_19385 [Candidatus Pacearchaeota archaeon]|nr:hypothetical protein [Candidatus Pacearchaeota archaeon]|tara:strand:+ start:1137 stop:2033 length:897 start_codon:yes stop_codon:yes gene_type:complete